MVDNYISTRTGSQIDGAVTAVNDLNNKIQGKLTAGTNITITADNTISVTGGAQNIEDGSGKWNF